MRFAMTCQEINAIPSFHAKDGQSNCFRLLLSRAESRQSESPDLSRDGRLRAVPIAHRSSAGPPRSTHTRGLPDAKSCALRRATPRVVRSGELDALAVH